VTAITFLLFSTAYRGRGTQSAVIAPSRSEAIRPLVRQALKLK